MGGQIVHDKDTSASWRARANTRKYALEKREESVDGRSTTLPDIYPSTCLLTWQNILCGDGHEHVEALRVSIRARLAASDSNVRLARGSVGCRHKNAAFIQINYILASDVLYAIWIGEMPVVPSPLDVARVKRLIGSGGGALSGQAKSVLGFADLGRTVESSGGCIQVCIHFGC